MPLLITKVKLKTKGVWIIHSRNFLLDNLKAPITSI